MGIRRWTGAGRAIAATVAGLLVATAAAAAPAAAVEVGRVTALPFASFSDLTVHPGTGRVYLSGGDQVVATDRTGRILRTIVNQPGAAGMALSADGGLLYVALNDARAISVLDARRLSEVGRIDLGTACPADLAVAVGRLWFTAACATHTSASLGSVDLSAATPTSYPMSYPAAQGPPLLAAVHREGWPETLVVLATDLSSSALHSYDITFGEPEPVRTVSPSPGIVRDVTVTGDGAGLLVANLQPDHQIYSVLYLEPVGSYPSDRYPNAVALGAGDRVAAGIDDLYGNATDLFVYESGAAQPTWTYDFGLRDNGTAYQSVAARGLGWAPDNRYLYAVTTRSDGTAPQLHTLIP